LQHCGYRFHNTRADQLARSLCVLRDRHRELTAKIRAEEDSMSTRDFVSLGFPGLGLKQSRMLLRDIGATRDLAIIDVHTYNFLSEYVEEFNPARRGDYLKAVCWLRDIARCHETSLAAVDLAIWAASKTLSGGRRMLNCVCLASGGLDFLVCMHLLTKQGIEFVPVFVNYGQLNRDREFESLRKGCEALNCRPPIYVDMPGFGKVVKSGVTDAECHIYDDAFTPNRNLLFLVAASAVGYQLGVKRVVLGFLTERSTLFPDQSNKFLRKAEAALSCSLGAEIKIIAPLRSMNKEGVLMISKELGVKSAYSCHAGGAEPCGKCIACLEYEFLEAEDGRTK